MYLCLDCRWVELVYLKLVCVCVFCLAVVSVNIVKLVALLFTLGANVAGKSGGYFQYTVK